MQAEDNSKRFHWWKDRKQSHIRKQYRIKYPLQLPCWFVRWSPVCERLFKWTKRTRSIH